MKKDFYIVGIGASAGGLEAIQHFFQHFPPIRSAAFVIIQHLSPDFKSLMNELLAKYTALPIVKLEEDTKAQPGYIYLVTPQTNVIIEEGILKPINHQRTDKVNLPIDLFFHSLGQDKQSCALGVILSGTGTDGSRGIKTIHEQGGLVMVQDADEAKFDGMPRAAMLSGVADYTLPVERLADEVSRVVSNGAMGPAPEAVEQLPATEEDYLHDLLGIIHAQTRIDFTLYRPDTLLRRISKRMHIVRVDSIEAYYRYVQQNLSEAEILTKEFLIGVSQFFRDEQVWKDLDKHVVRPLVAQKKDHDTIRVWVPGCSTGEEAYTLGMLFLEHIKQSKRPISLKIFATDADKHAVDWASAGFYGENVANAVSGSRLSKFFERIDTGFKVKKEFREHFVFAAHNFIADPPFINMDLVSCRNALIYIQPSVQQKVFDSFYFSLKKSGYLLLGKSESLGEMQQAFTTVVSASKIFQAAASYQQPMRPSLKRSMAQLSDSRSFSSPEPPAAASPIVAHDQYTELLSDAYAPGGIFVNPALDVLYIHGEVEQYLKLPRRQVRFQLDNMVEPALAVILKSGIDRALAGETVVLRQVAFQKKGETLTVDLEFRIFRPEATQDTLVLIAFLDTQSTSATKAPPAVLDQVVQERIQLLEKKLGEKDKELQHLREQLESSNEELQTSNEELIASNEELQSSNEELQSFNEELYTVNTELQEKIEELTHTSSDIDNLLRSTEIATIFLDHNLCIRFFTPATAEIINVTQSDIGRSIAHFTTYLQGDYFLEEARQVLHTQEPVEKEVANQQAKHFLMRISPYHRADGTSDGLVATFVNLTEIKEAHQALQDSKNYAESIVNSVRDPLMVLNEQLTVISANPAFYEKFKVAAEETEGKRVYDLGSGQWDIPELKKLLEEIIPQDQLITDYFISHDFPSIGPRIVSVSAVRVVQSRELPALILMGVRDVTERETAREHLQETVERLELVLHASKVGIWEWSFVTDEVVSDERQRAMFGVPLHTKISAQEIIARIHPDDSEQVNAAIQQSIEEKDFYNEDFRVIHDDGSIHYLNGQGSVLFDQQGQPIKMLGTNVDITEKKRKELKHQEHEERLAMVVNGTSDGIFDVRNMETGESWWSPRMYELLGMTPGEVTPHMNSFQALVHSEDTHLVDEAIARYLENRKLFDIEIRLRHQAKGYRWYRSRANLIEGQPGVITRMVGAFSDIHSRKIGEIKLEKTNRKLRIANEYLDNFVFTAAHDLRSPIANLKSLVALCQSDTVDKSLVIDKVSASVNRLDDTLNGLIQIVDIQQHDQAKIEQLNFQEIYQKLVADFEPKIQEALATIKTDFQVSSIDYIAPFLESMMRNLLSNAIKYRAEERPLQIQLSTYQQKEHVVLQIQDNGIGINLERFREKIFKPFERLTRQANGKGIGMHLVKSMVEKNEGFIEVESTVGEGTVFKVCLKPYE